MFINRLVDSSDRVLGVSQKKQMFENFWFFQEPGLGYVEVDSCHTGLRHHPGLCPSGRCCRLEDSCPGHSEPLKE